MHSTMHSTVHGTVFMLSCRHRCERVFDGQICPARRRVFYDTCTMISIYSLGLPARVGTHCKAQCGLRSPTGQALRDPKNDGGNPALLSGRKICLVYERKRIGVPPHMY